MPRFPHPARGYAEFVTAPSRQWARKPLRLSHKEAAAVPLAALTAWQALVDTADVQPGQRVLVHAGAGGVGHLAVQIAKHRGAHVLATASRGRHIWLTELGVDEPVDYTAVRFEEVIADVDVVVDLVGDGHDRTSTRSLQVLRPGGLLIAVPSGASPDLLDAAAARGVRATALLVEPDSAALRAIAELLDTGKIVVEVAEVFALEDAAAAHAAGESGHTRGKLVLRVAGGRTPDP